MKLNFDRPNVSEEFVDVMIKYYLNWLEKAEKVVSMFPYKAKMYTANAARIMPIVKRQSPDLHSGLDYEITRLRGAPFKKYEVMTHNDQQYLVGITKHITLVENKRSVMGELGAYRIFLSPAVFVNSDIAALHMIPERNPASVFRHPHHYAAVWRMPGAPSEWRSNSKMFGHPLDARTGNCWGTSGGPVKSVIDNIDIPGLLLILHGHISVYGISPPVGMAELDFDHTALEEK